MTRRRWGARLVAVLGIAVAIGGLALIFTDDPLPPSGPEIERSLDVTIGDADDREAATCRRDGATWRCKAGPATYRDTVDRDRCWTAERAGRRGERFPETLDNCVDDGDTATPGSSYD